MREMIIRAWCDRCESLGNDRTEARHTYSVGIVKGETRPAPRVIELCDAHDAEMDWLPKLLADHSIPLDTKHPAVVTPAAPVPRDRVECRVCGVEFSKSALVPHVWSKHRPGQTRPEHPHKCPDCGLVNPTGMGQHRSQAHGWTPLIDAYRGLV